MSSTPDHGEIVRELTKYIVDFVERPTPSLVAFRFAPLLARHAWKTESSSK